MAPSRGSIPSCGFALELSGWNSGRRLLSLGWFLWSGWQKKPKRLTKKWVWIRLHRVFHLFLGSGVLFWSRNFKIVSGQIFWALDVSRGVCGSHKKPRQRWAQHPQFLPIPWMSMVIFSNDLAWKSSLAMDGFFSGLTMSNYVIPVHLCCNWAKKRTKN